MTSAHEGPSAAWRSALAGARLHHAWLLTGPAGVGKREFALAAAAQLVGAEEGNDLANHPDVLQLARLPADEKEAKLRDEGKPFKRKRNIAVDQVRQLQKRLTTRPTLSAQRAIVIDPADDLERNAANALLKSLEEPPAGNVFFLVAHRPGRLLPTIRSRCRVLRFDPLEDAEVHRAVAEARPEAESVLIDRAVSSAQGSPGAALQWLDEGLGPIDAAIRSLLKGERTDEARAALAQAIGARPSAERLSAIFTLASRLVHAHARTADAAARPSLIEAYARLADLAFAAPTANFDAGLLTMEIAGLLARAGVPREAA